MIRTAFGGDPERAMSKALETEFDEAMMIRRVTRLHVMVVSQTG